MKEEKLISLIATMHKVNKILAGKFDSRKLFSLDLLEIEYLSRFNTNLINELCNYLDPINTLADEIVFLLSKMPNLSLLEFWADSDESEITELNLYRLKFKTLKSFMLNKPAICNKKFRERWLNRNEKKASNKSVKNKKVRG